MRYIEHFRYLYENDDAHSDTLRKTGFWGNQGAGCIFLAKDTGRLLLAHRSRYVLQPGTWGVWGGAIDANEDPEQAVKREASEETGYDGPLKLIPLVKFRKDKFVYHNYLAIVENQFKPQLNWETQNYKWCEYGEWPHPLHFGLKYLIENSGEKIQNIIKNLPNISDSNSLMEWKVVFFN